MLMGAFFAVLGADKTDSWILGLLCGILSGGAAALLYAFFAIHLRDRPDSRRHGHQLPRPRPDRVPLHRHLRPGGDLVQQHPGHPGRPPQLHQGRAVPGADLLPDEPDDLAGAPARRRLVDRHVQDADRAPHPLRRRASARRRHGRDQRLRHSLLGRRPLRDAGGRGRRLPLDRVRQLLWREHDRRTRVHRAGSA